MARINLSAQLHADKRFTKLILKLGNKWTAIGALFEAWDEAHKHHSIKNPRGLIPREKWIEQECCEEIIAVKLAKIEGEFVYMHGAIEQFKSLLEAKKRAQRGGQKSAQKRQESLKNKQVYESLDFKPGVEPGVDRPVNCAVNPSSSSSSFSSFYEGDHHRDANEPEVPGSKAEPVDDDDFSTALRLGNGEVGKRENLDSVETLLSVMFAGSVPKDIRRAAPQMLARFGGDPDAVKSELTGLWQNPKLHKGEGVTNRLGYLRQALINHFELDEV